MEKDLLDFLLSDFRKKPGMYLGSYKLSLLPTLVAGFMVANNFYDETKSALDRFSDFHEWFEKKNSFDRPSSWTIPFLEIANHDEKAALDLFFSELETYILIINKANKS